MLKKMILNIIILTVTLSCSKEVDDLSSATWDMDKSDTVVAVESLNLTKGVLYPTVTSSGLISGIKEAYIISETRGIIESVDFEIGEEVDTTEVLVNVDNSIAKLSLEQAKEQFENADLDLVSTEKFYKKGSASLSDLTRARSSANGAKVLYETALKTVEDASIKSPIFGAVAWKDSGVTQGNFLNQGQKIAKIVDLSKIRVEVSLGERQIGLIKLNSKASIKLVSIKNSQPLIGNVVAIAAGSDASTGSYKVIVEADNSQKDVIRAGMSCSVTIDTNDTNALYIVPTDSIVVREGKEYIFVDNNGVAEPMEIIKGEVVGSRTSIDPKTQLSENETIIISGLNSIKPGIKVNSTIIGSSGEWL